MAEVIERNCGSDLDRIAVVLGVPREIVSFMAIRAAERRFDFFTPEIKEAFRNRAMEYRDGEARAAKLFKSIDNLRNKGCAIDGLPGPLQPQAWRDSRKRLNEYLRKHGRANHDQAIPILVSSILSYRTQFDCWEALARVIAEAYYAAGREAEARRITADKLLRAAKPYRKKTRA